MKWKPIETAPKDRTYILAVTTSGIVWLVSWDKMREEWTRFNCRDSGLNLTHWMPLPQSPTKSTT
jgi:hypothetical protein